MDVRDAARICAALAIATAAGWVGAWLWMFERASRPTPLPQPLHLFDRDLVDGTIAGR